MSLKKRQAGFTLVEIVLTIILLSFAAMIMIPIIQAMTTVTTPVQRQQAISLGQGLMDEILSKRWDENTPLGGAPIVTDETRVNTRGEGGNWPTNAAVQASLVGLDGVETRPVFDDVDDYDTFSETGSFTDQTGGGGVTMPGFTRIVGVRYVLSSLLAITATTPVGSFGTNLPDTTDTKRIVVTVTTPTGESFDFVALVCNF